HRKNVGNGNWRVRARSQNIPRSFRNVMPLAIPFGRYHPNLTQMPMEFLIREGCVSIEKRTQLAEASLDERAHFLQASVDRVFARRQQAVCDRLLLPLANRELLH